jgi:hypothetical protein
MGFFAGPLAVGSIIDKQNSLNNSDVCTDMHDAVKISE